MTREQKIAKAKALREQGLTYREIGERLDVTSHCAWEWLHPDRVREKNRRQNAKPQRKRAKRAWEAGQCTRCGGRVAAAKRKEATGLCDACAKADKTQAARERTERFIERRREGLLNTDIAAEEGCEPHVVALVLSRAGRYGLAVPPSPYYRNRAG